MKVKEFILNTVKSEGVKHVFLVPGGLIDPFISILPNSQITPIVACHEAGATYMADGYSRASNHLGVSFCIGGPGITNATTALAAALTDESSVLIISGDTAIEFQGRNTFQDSSIHGNFSDIEIIRNVTNEQLVLSDPTLAPSFLHKLLSKSLSSPKSPVHLIIPKNIQEAEINLSYQPISKTIANSKTLDREASNQFWDLIRDKKRIVIYAGAGIEKANAASVLQQFAEEFEIPVATTLRAKGVFPENHHLSLGVFGYGGTRQAIETILSDDVEVLLVLGSGLNQRDTLFWNKKFQPENALIQVDVNPNALANVYPTQLNVVSDCGEFLRYLMQSPRPRKDLLSETIEDRKTWFAKTQTMPRYYDIENCTSDAIPIHPARVICDLRKAMPKDTVLLVDSGAHRAFAGHYWRAYEPLHYLSATNLGPMGWAIPASIGAKLARPDKPCVVITGDGCMLMHGIEIHTAARYGVNVIFVVLNNSALGNVYLRQKKVSEGAAELTEIPTRDWSLFATAMGAEGIRVDKPDQLIPAFQKALMLNKPVLIDIRCGRDYPTPVAPFAKAQSEWHE